MNTIKLFEEFKNLDKSIEFHFGRDGFKLADKFFSFKEVYDIIEHYTGFYGNRRRAIETFQYYIDSVKSINKKGGYLYRLIYVSDISKINTDDIGQHFTTESSVIDELIANGWKSYYGSNGEISVLITVKTQPDNLSIKDVDIHGSLEEFEVNIIDYSKIEIINIKEI